MESRITIITLGVKDFQKSYHFYNSGLGFQTNAKPTDRHAFFKTNGTLLSIYPIDKLAEDISPELPKEKSLFSGITLAYNVKEKSKVDEVLEEARNAGGRIVKPARDTFWGGYSGYFSDPDDYYWEVAYYDKFQYDNAGNLII